MYEDINDVGKAISAGKLDALYERIRKAGGSDPKEYKPIKLNADEASWLMEVLIEIQVHRLKETPVMQDGERDRLLIKMAMVIACDRGPGMGTAATRALAEQIKDCNNGEYP
jgi:hypothetical protein